MLHHVPPGARGAASRSTVTCCCFLQSTSFSSPGHVIIVSVATCVCRGNRSDEFAVFQVSTTFPGLYGPRWYIAWRRRHPIIRRVQLAVVACQIRKRLTGWPPPFAMEFISKFTCDIAHSAVSTPLFLACWYYYVHAFDWSSHRVNKYICRPRPAELWMGAPWLITKSLAYLVFTPLRE